MVLLDFTDKKIRKKNEEASVFRSADFVHQGDGNV